MATTETPRTIVRQFAKREKITKRLDSLVVHSYQIDSYGEHYPLVIRIENDLDGGERMLLNTTRSSATTNRHRRGAEEGLADAGFFDTMTRVTRKVPRRYGYGGGEHVFAVYKKA